MCIITNQPALKTAEHDITCLKAVEVIIGVNNERVAITPYAAMVLNDDTIKGKSIMTPHDWMAADMIEKSIDLELAECSASSVQAEITKDLIHTFAVPKTRQEFIAVAKEMCSLCDFLGRRDYSARSSTLKEIDCPAGPMVVEMRLYKCVIPAGSLMYVSFDKKEYCSNKIKVLGWKRREQYDWNPIWKNWHSPNEPGKIGKFFKELKKNIKKHTNPCA